MQRESTSRGVLFITLTSIGWPTDKSFLVHQTVDGSNLTLEPQRDSWQWDSLSELRRGGILYTHQGMQKWRICVLTSKFNQSIGCIIVLRAYVSQRIFALTKDAWCIMLHDTCYSKLAFLDSDITWIAYSLCFNAHHMNASLYFADLHAKHILVKLPLPNRFNLWLSQNCFTTFKDHLPDAWFQWGDTLSNEVLCTVQMEHNHCEFPCK